MEKYYVLRKNNYYLSSVYYIDEELSSFEVDNEYRKLYSDYETAEKDRRTIFIETGLNFEIEVFKNED